MTVPVPRRRSMERWRGWPRDFWDPFGEFTQLWNRMGQLFESAGEGGPDTWMPMVETEGSRRRLPSPGGAARHEARQRRGRATRQRAAHQR